MSLVEIVERTDSIIVLTESAATKIRTLMAEEPEGEAAPDQPPPAKGTKKRAARSRKSA